MSRQSKIASITRNLESLITDRRTHFVVFVDLCNSTAYKQLLIEQSRSDSIWLTRQLTFLQMVATQVKNTSGTVVKTMGDGLLATFDYSTPAEEILFAFVNLILAFEKSTLYTGADTIEIRVALDYGESVNGSLSSRGYDPIGLCVDRCSRLAAMARPDGLAFSKDFKDQLGETIAVMVHPNLTTISRVEQNLKGIGPSVFYVASI